jgi:hypothetical protein
VISILREFFFVGTARICGKFKTLLIVICCLLSFTVQVTGDHLEIGENARYRLHNRKNII